MDNEFLKICEYAKTTPWIDDTDPEIIWKQAEIAAEELSRGKNKNKKLVRICGQTGSGKTTQVLWAVQEYNKINQLNPLVIGVRDFASFHPKYDEFLKEFGKGEIREKTNGFALKCLTATLSILLKQGVDVLLDMTLLDPVYEEYVLNLEKKCDYDVTYHILAVNTLLSKQFLDKRFKESGRIVYGSSIEYFNNILNKGFRYVCENDAKNNCYIWTAFDKKFVYFGLVKDAFDVFIQNQNRIEEIKYSEEELKKEKLKALI